MTEFDTEQPEIEAMLQEYRNFVEFCEDKEKQTGEPVTIVADI